MLVVLTITESTLTNSNSNLFLLNTDKFLYDRLILDKLETTSATVAISKMVLNQECLFIQFWHHNKVA